MSPAFCSGKDIAGCFLVALQIPTADRLAFIVILAGTQPGRSTPTTTKSLSSFRHETVMPEHSSNRALEGTVQDRGV